MERTRKGSEARNYKQNLGIPHFVLALALATCGKENAEGC